MAFIRAIVRAYEVRQLDPSTALAQAQIAPSHLKKPLGKVTALQMEWLSAAAMRELDDEALGWFSRRLPWGSYGMLVRASLSAPQLGLAMRRWCRHHGLLTDDVQLRLEVHGGQARIVVQEQPARHDLGQWREFCTVSLLRNALGVACWLTDSRIPVQGVQLHLARPPHADSYRVLFDGPVVFAPQAPSASSHLAFDAAYLQLPVRRDEAALQRMLQRALLLTVRPYRRDRLLVETVRQALRKEPALGQRAQALAAQLGLSVRSLHRQLQDEGASLQHLKDQTRRELACERLLRSQAPLKQVAAEVGFAHEKSFIRAFRQWTGMSPRAWQAQATQGS